MGSSASNTRRAEFMNNDPTNVIKVSEDVVDRIKGSQANLTVRQGHSKNEFINPPQGVIIPGQFYLNEPSLTSLQLRQANVAELKKNDEYWQNRLKALEANHKKINEVMEQETQRALEEFQGKKTDGVKITQQPCLDNKKAVTECYKCYPNEPMKCAKLVQAFQECVDLKRSCLMQNKA